MIRQVGRVRKIPCDIKQECLWIVRGYDRRVKQYKASRREVIDGTPCNFVDTKSSKGKQSIREYMPHGSGNGRPSENKFEQLQAIEEWPETKKMRAVEFAQLCIGADIKNESLRKRLKEGMMLNCKDRNKFPFRRLNLPDMSESDFYRRKEKFLIEIAESLGML